MGQTAWYEVREQAEQHVLKVTEGRPNAVDKEIALVIDTTFGKQEIADSFSIRRRWSFPSPGPSRYRRRPAWWPGPPDVAHLVGDVLQPAQLRPHRPGRVDQRREVQSSGG